MALSILPCDDFHDVSQIYSNEIVISDSHDDDHDHDLCSPFCSCDCCQTIAELVFNIPTPNFIKNSNTAVTPIFHTEKERISTLWRPPITIS